jgi:hypothetical protein
MGHARAGYTSKTMSINPWILLAIAVALGVIATAIF